MTSEIDKLKHFYAENYSGTNFTDDLNDGEEFLYTTIGIKDDKEVTFLCKYVKNKHIKICPNCVFNNRFRTTKNTEAIVFENGGFVGNLGLVKNYGRNILKLFINIELIQVK